MKSIRYNIQYICMFSEFDCLTGQNRVLSNRKYQFERPAVTLRDGSRLPSRSWSATCPGRGSRKLVFRVLRWGSPCCCATPCRTLRTPLLRHWCHRGLLSCSTAIPTQPTPREVGGILTLISHSVMLFGQGSNSSTRYCFSRPGGCRAVSWAHVPSSARGSVLHPSLRTPNHTPEPGPRGTRLEPRGGLHPALPQHEPPWERGASTGGATKCKRMQTHCHQTKTHAGMTFINKPIRDVSSLKLFWSSYIDWGFTCFRLCITNVLRKISVNLTCFPPDYII